VVPEFGNVGNPLDITGQGVFQGELIERSVALMAEASGVDLVSYVRGFPSWLDARSPTGLALQQAVSEHPETVFVVMSLSNGHLQPMQVPGSVLLEPTVQLAGVPYLQGAEESLKAIGALMRYAAFQRRRGEPAPARLTSTDVTRAARTLVCSSPSRVVSHEAGAELLALYGIPLAAGALASSVDDALGGAEHVGYPVAVKTASPDVPHKTDVGAVRVGVSSPAELRIAFAEVRAGAARASDAAVDADVLVQAMVSDADEVLLGMTRDEQFGPVVAVGVGGTLVEVLADTRLLLPPVSAGEAEASLRALRGYRMLAGVRGRPARDVSALVDTMRRFGELCGDVGDLVDEIDLNPILVRAAGRGLCAVDWLIVRRSDPRGG
jgi:acetyltransferase